jgi:hypothetical protein
LIGSQTARYVAEVQDVTAGAMHAEERKPAPALLYQNERRKFASALAGSPRQVHWHSLGRIGGGLHDGSLVHGWALESQFLSLSQKFRAVNVLLGCSSNACLDKLDSVGT